MYVHVCTHHDTRQNASSKLCYRALQQFSLFKMADGRQWVFQAKNSYLIMWVSVDVLSAVIIIVIFVVQR